MAAGTMMEGVKMAWPGDATPTTIIGLGLLAAISRPASSRAGDPCDVFVTAAAFANISAITITQNIFQLGINAFQLLLLDRCHVQLQQA
jgi:hypothetical protein